MTRGTESASGDPTGLAEGASELDATARAPTRGPHRGNLGDVADLGHRAVRGDAQGSYPNDGASRRADLVSGQRPRRPPPGPLAPADPGQTEDLSPAAEPRPGGQS